MWVVMFPIVAYGMDFFVIVGVGFALFLGFAPKHFLERIPFLFGHFEFLDVKRIPYIAVDDDILHGGAALRAHPALVLCPRSRGRRYYTSRRPYELLLTLAYGLHFYDTIAHLFGFRLEHIGQCRILVHLIATDIEPDMEPKLIRAERAVHGAC